MSYILVPKPKKVVTQVALTGFPCSGKSSIGRVLEDKLGFMHISTDMIREGIYGEMSIFDLGWKEWSVIYSELVRLRNGFMQNGRDVCTDNCPYENRNKYVTVNCTPELAESLADIGAGISRYLIHLEVNPDIIRQRSREKGRGDDRSMENIAKLERDWQYAASISDAYGDVEILSYANNTPDDQRSLLKDMGSRLGRNLL